MDNDFPYESASSLLYKNFIHQFKIATAQDKSYEPYFFYAQQIFIAKFTISSFLKMGIVEKSLKRHGRPNIGSRLNIYNT